MLFFMMFLFSMTGCAHSQPFPNLAFAQIQDENHKVQLHYYDSPYTMCYENKDGTYSFYVFSSPIQFKTNGGYEIIDNSIVKSEHEDYVYENKANNVKTYFPEKISSFFLIECENEYISFQPDVETTDFSDAESCIITNMYGDKVMAVVYKSQTMELYFYPTRCGIKTEIVFKEKPESNIFNYHLKTSTDSVENKNNGYIVLKTGEQKSSVIYAPRIKDKANNIYLSGNVELEKGEDEGNYELSIPLNGEIFEMDNVQYPVRIDPSFDIYQNKLPDSTVYSKVETNNYLADCAVIGEDPRLGEGWHFMRLRVQYFIGLSPSLVLSAHYSIRALSPNLDGVGLKMEKVEKQWSSTGLKWKSKEDVFQEITTAYPDKNGNYMYEITGFIGQCLEDTILETESKGVVLRAENPKDNILLATSDNSLYSSYLCIRTKDLPGFFSPKDNINDTQF